MDNTENEIMEYATNAVVVLNGSYSNSQDNLSNMGCNEKFQEFEGKFNMLDTKYNDVLDKGKAYDNMANQTNNVKNNNLISDKHKSKSSKNILSDAFANIQKDENQIFSDIEEMIRINNENNKETENADNSIWSMIGKSLDNLFTNLVGGLVTSAKAEIVLPPLYGDIGIADNEFFNKLLGQGSITEVQIGKYTYDLANHILYYGKDKSIKVDYYIPLSVKDLPEDELTVGEIPLSLSTMDTTTILCGHYETGFSQNDMKSIQSGDVLIVPYKDTTGKSFADQHEGVYEAAAFGRMFMSLHDSSYDVKNNIIGFSSGGGSAIAIYSEYDFFNGRVGSADYAPEPLGSSRGSKNDQYTTESLNNLQTKLLKNKQKVDLWYFSDGENTEKMNNYAANNLGTNYAYQHAPINGGHSSSHFINKVVQNFLNNKQNNKKGSELINDSIRKK